MGLNADTNIKKSHIALLLMLAEADDRDHVNEEKFINNVAAKIGLTPQEVNEIDKHPEDLTFLLPEKEVKRMNILYHLLFLMKIDGSVVEEEKELCHEIGFLLGFNKHMVDELINVMSDHIGKQIPDGVLLEIIKKYMN